MAVSSSSQSAVYFCFWAIATDIRVVVVFLLHHMSCLVRCAEAIACSAIGTLWMWSAEC